MDTNLFGTLHNTLIHNNNNKKKKKKKKKNQPLLLDHGADVGIASFDMELPIDVAQDKDTQAILREAMEKQKVDASAARKAEEQQMLDDANTWLKTGQYP
ncbi:unnamed protein product [Dibothriocephalus latus]|uniref:Uncharacterized protein n=1 Tax=Dibothriocephalus latus TaxID=60516 RepID=A0A3P7P1Z7_DIBLA|nr:unnamed protein product [Dibothriocephalus latus]